MDGLVMAGQLLLSLTILVAVHEWGHYITARMFGIKVERFYIFFDFLFPFPSLLNFSLLKFKRGDTEYGLGWFPMGGYVKIAGMMDESMDKDALKEEPKEWEFRAKPPWQRLIVMLGGIIVNVIVGILIFFIMNLSFGYQPLDAINDTGGIYAFDYGKSVGFQTGDKIVSVNGEVIERWKDANSPSNYFGATVQVERNGQIVDVVVPDTAAKAIKNGEYLFMALNYEFSVSEISDTLYLDGDSTEGTYSPAYAAGVRVNDKIVKIGEEEVKVFGDLKYWLIKNRDSKVSVTVDRQGELLTFDSIAVDSATASIGFLSTSPPYDSTRVDYESTGSAFSYSVYDAFNVVITNARGLGQIFSGKANVMDSLSGPIGIAKAFGGEWNWRSFWGLTGILSMVLAFMNLLPIPALDGGHVVITIIEWIRGKELPQRVTEIIQFIGLIIVLGLMVLVFGIDLLK